MIEQDKKTDKAYDKIAYGKIDLEKLKAEQNFLAKLVRLEDRLKLDEIKYVIGVDQAFEDFKGEKTNVISAAVLMSFPELEVVEEKTLAEAVSFPYIPGYLMFREGESAIKVVKELAQPRTVVLVDGSGIAHPRRCGLACFVGIKTGAPTIGITKHRLVGEYEEPKRVGEAKPLIFEGERIGYVLKTCKRCRPIFISPGSYISPELSLEVVKACLRGFKLPEPIRIADRLAKLAKLDKLAKPSKSSKVMKNGG
ncbi:MAG: endonuclease V [Archaeoglobus sp.]|nr:endonuclease V [Archaeoglobus sp.]